MKFRDTRAAVRAVRRVLDLVDSGELVADDEVSRTIVARLDGALHTLDALGDRDGAEAAALLRRTLGALDEENAGAERLVTQYLRGALDATDS